MSEVRRQVKTFAVDMMCPKCGEGTMRPDGPFVLMTSPPKYPHICERCGYVESYYESYPRIEYEVINGDTDAQ